jgi:hypothetical protein
MKIKYKFCVIIFFFICTACVVLFLEGEHMSKKYRIVLHDGVELSFSYIKKDEIKEIFSSGQWISEINLRCKFIPYIYSYAGRYLGFFPENSLRGDYGIICDNRILFEKLKANVIVLFNPDNNFRELHFMELLRENQVKNILKNSYLERVEIQDLSSEYTKYFKYLDGRILAILPGGEGELFMNQEVVYKLRKMEDGMSTN